MRLHFVYSSGLLWALASITPAQVVTEIAAPTVPTSYIDMDAVGPVGPTSLAAINAGGSPTPATIQNISLTPSTAANPGIYNTNPSCIRALGLAYPSGVGLELLDSSAGQFTSFNARLDLGGPSTEFGVGIGDWVSTMVLEFYSGNSLVTSRTSSSYANCNQKFFQMSGGTFDRVDIRASSNVGNWVITEVSIQNVASGNGSFTNVFAGCGGANLATTGLPNLGASVSFTATPATGLPFIMIGSAPLGVPICAAGCIVGQNMDVVLPGATFQANIPRWPFLIGGQVYFQAIELGTAGGCTVGSPAQLVTTNTIRATIG